MTVGNFKPFVGSLEGDPLIGSPFDDDNSFNLRAENLDIIYGLEGNDSLSTADGFTAGDRAILVGGADDDDYLLRNDSSVVILDNGDSSGEDTLIAEGIGFNKLTTFALTIDDRHLYAFDIDSDQYVLLIDWQKTENQIESFELADDEFSYDEFVEEVNNARNNPIPNNFLGDFTWEEVQNDPTLLGLDANINLEDLGLSTETINSAIDTVVETANNFEETIESLDPNDDVNASLSDTDNSYIFNEERYFYDFYSLPIEGEIEPGDIVQITASSDDFDPLLFVLDSRGEVLEFDNDAELIFGVGSGEPLFISVESREPDKEGDYELSVETVNFDISNINRNETNFLDNAIYEIDSIQTTDSLTGALSTEDIQIINGGDTFFQDNYLLVDGNVGEQVRVTLNSDFDGELFVSSIDSNGNSTTLLDIDIAGVGGTEQGTFTIDPNLDYLVSISSFEPGDLGDYTLATEVI